MFGTGENGGVSLMTVIGLHALQEGDRELLTQLMWTGLLAQAQIPPFLAASMLRTLGEKKESRESRELEQLRRDIREIAAELVELREELRGRASRDGKRETLRGEGR